jgi:hypothetical protein
MVMSGGTKNGWIGDGLGGGWGKWIRELEASKRILNSDEFGGENTQEGSADESVEMQRRTLLCWRG